MPRVNNNISLSNADDSRKEKYEDKESVGNRELSQLTIELDSVRNSTHETNKRSSSDGASGYLDQAWKWLRTGYNGQPSVENSDNEEGTKLQEILTEGEKLRQQAWLLSCPIDEKNVASAWKGCFFKRCLVGVGILTGSCVLGRSGYQFYAGKQASTTDPQGNATKPVPSDSSVTQPNRGGILNEDLAFRSPYVEIIHTNGKREVPERSVRHTTKFEKLPRPRPTNNNNEVINNNQKHHLYELFDDVKIWGIDYSCAENRKSLTAEDIFRVVAGVLENPYDRAKDEWLVFYKYHLQHKGCPKKSDLPTYNKIINSIVELIEYDLYNLPGFTPLRVMRKISPLILNAIADSIEGKDISISDMVKITGEAISISQIMISSLDAETKKSIFGDAKGSIALSELFKLKNRNAYITLNQKEYKLAMDSKGPYILKLDGELKLKKVWGIYSSTPITWHQRDSVDYVLPNPSNDKEIIGLSSSLLKNSRSIASRKNISALDFLGQVLIESHIINKEDFDDIVVKMSHSSPLSDYLNEVKEVSSQADLINLKSSHLVLFVERNNLTSIKHKMISIGNGLFSGADLKIISDEDFHSSIVTAEQLGTFGDEGFISNKGQRLIIYSGAAKGSRLFSINLRKIIEKLDAKNYKIDESGSYAVAEIMSNMGSVTPEFISILRERLEAKGPINNLIKLDETLINDIENKVLPGEAIVMSDNDSINSKNIIYGLRISNDEFFIPSLYEPLISRGDRGTIIKTSFIKEKIKTDGFFIRKFNFEQHKLRINLLLGKDALFHENMGVLTIRGHGLPMTMNYMSPYEIVNIIKGLAIKKQISFDRITTIKLNSCFGAVGYPSTGRIIASLMEKKVIAYSGKYSESMTEEEGNMVVYEPSPLRNLEQLVAGITERNIDFIRKVRSVFSYLNVNGYPNVPSTSRRNKRDHNYFNVFLMDLGALIMQALDLSSFIAKYKKSFSYNENSRKIILDKILNKTPNNSIDFFYSLMDILQLSHQASMGLNFYLQSGKKNTEYSNDLYYDDIESKKTFTIYNYNNSECDEAHKLLESISENLGISDRNDYISPRKWNETGSPMDIYLHDYKYKFFLLKNMGTPSLHDWHYPIDCKDNDNWIYAGSHPGTLEQPKNWYEYGKAGTIYYEDGYGYLILKDNGRPSDHNWYYPFNGESNTIWGFITWKAGTYETPYSFQDKGNKGDVYFEGGHYYVLKSSGCPLYNNWSYHPGNIDNEHWFYSGLKKGTLDEPMTWNDYGKSGSVYYHEGFGYFKLKSDGRPSDNNWHYPMDGGSNVRWYFLCFEVGSFRNPKLKNVEGLAGEVYYSVENRTYYILRRDGKPSVLNWSFPLNKESNQHWIYAGTNEGVLEEPKQWSEYGKAGSIYYEKGYGYYKLNKEGSPYEHGWYFPGNGSSDVIWTFLKW